MSAWNTVCWVFPTLPSVLGKALHVPGRREPTAACSEQGRRSEDEGAAHCEQAWFTVGLVGSPAYPAHYSTQLINKSHFHEWWKLHCLRGYRKLIIPSGQQPRLEGRLLATAFIPTLLLWPSAIIQLSLPCVSLVVITIDQLNISWMRIHTLGTAGAELVVWICSTIRGCSFYYMHNEKST